MRTAPRRIPSPPNCCATRSSRRTTAAVSRAGDADSAGRPRRRPAEPGMLIQQAHAGGGQPSRGGVRCATALAPSGSCTTVRRDPRDVGGHRAWRLEEQEQQRTWTASAELEFRPRRGMWIRDGSIQTAISITICIQFFFQEKIHSGRGLTHSRAMAASHRWSHAKAAGKQRRFGRNLYAPFEALVNTLIAT